VNALRPGPEEDRAAAGPPRIEILPAAAWAPAVAAELGAHLAARPSLRICLPTGDTP
jgi:hypothetical protein